MGTVGRRRFLIGFGGLIAAPSPIWAQPTNKVYRIAYLSAGDRGMFSAAFLEGLRDLGWKEGHDFVVDGRWAGGEHQRLPEMARELVRREPDVIVSITTPATRAAVDATRSIPVVFTMVADPVGSGIVDSLAHPGANATGLCFVPELSFFGKQMELLKELVPDVTRIAVIWIPTNPVHSRILDATKETAKHLGIEAVSSPAQTLDQLKQIFTALPQDGSSAVLVIADFWFHKNRQYIHALSLSARVPVMHGGQKEVEEGGVISYNQDLLDTQRQAARYVDRILRGANPSVLPVGRPSKYKLMINLKTARALGITVPRSMMMRADRLIE